MKPKIILFWATFPFLAIFMLLFGLLSWIPILIGQALTFANDVVNWALNGFEDWCFENETRYQPPWRH